MKRPRAPFALILAAGFAAIPVTAEPLWRRAADHRDAGDGRENAPAAEGNPGRVAITGSAAAGTPPEETAGAAVYAAS